MSDTHFFSFSTSNKIYCTLQYYSQKLEKLVYNNSQHIVYLDVHCNQVHFSITVTQHFILVLHYISESGIELFTVPCQGRLINVKEMRAESQEVY